MAENQQAALLARQRRRAWCLALLWLACSGVLAEQGHDVWALAFQAVAALFFVVWGYFTGLRDADAKQAGASSHE